MTRLSASGEARPRVSFEFDQPKELPKKMTDELQVMDLSPMGAL